MNKKTLLISILIGTAVFLFFLYRVGLDTIINLFRGIDLKYLLIYFGITTFTFFPNVLRWKVILKGYKKKIGFWLLFKETIAAHSISYLTPAVRIGGEPLRAYMLKKEAKVDLKTGSSSIIIDKFVEFVGSLIFGLVGLILLFFILGVSIFFKILLFSLIAYAFYGLFVFYYRTITNRDSFSRLFISWKLYKIKKISGFHTTLIDVEKRLGKFFKNNKKELAISSFYYFLYGVLIILEFKFLLLALGINASLATVLLSLTILGLVNFIPVPAALGFLEGSQTSLFHVLVGQGGIGFVLSLIVRIRNLIFVAIGFGFISYFSGSQIEKVRRKKKSNIKRNY